MRSRIAASLFALLVLGAIGGAAYRGYATLQRMGCGELAADVTEIHIPDSADGVTRFVALGDTGTGSGIQQAVARAARLVCRERGCDFAVLLGDNFYGGGLRREGDAQLRQLVDGPYGPLNVPIVAILGNHDLERNPIHQVMASLSHPQWKMPNFRFRFRAGLARFFATNTNCSALEWLRLAGKLEEESRDWIFVLGHHSLYSRGPHGGGEWISRAAWAWLIEANVDFMLSGHNHVLEHLVRPGLRPDYVVVGSSGGQKQRLRSYDDRGAEAESRFFSLQPGFAWFEVKPDSVRVVYYGAEGAALYEFTSSRTR